MRERLENAVIYLVVMLAFLYVAKFAGCVLQGNAGFYSAPLISVPR